MGGGVRMEVGVILKGQHEGSCGSGYMNLRRRDTHTCAHMQMNSSITGEIGIRRLVDGVSMSTSRLGYHSIVFTKCMISGNQNEFKFLIFYTTACESLIISIKISAKKS